MFVTFHLLLRACLLAATLTLTAVLGIVGAPRPVPNDGTLDALGFGACPLPCWAGITVGQTPFAQVDELARAGVPALDRQVLLSGSQLNLHATFEGRTYTGQVFYSGGLAWTVRLRGSLALWALLARVGVPDCVLALPTGGAAIYWDFVLADGEYVVMTATTDRIAFDAAADALTITAFDDTACGVTEVVRWRGFAPLWVYR